MGFSIYKEYRVAIVCDIRDYEYIDIWIYDHTNYIGSNCYFDSGIYFHVVVSEDILQLLKEQSINLLVFINDATIDIESMYSEVGTMLAGARRMDRSYGLLKLLRILKGHKRVSIGENSSADYNITNEDDRSVIDSIIKYIKETN